MRIFLAVPVPPIVADSLSEAQRRLREFLPDARWADKQGFHLTAKFLGEVDPARLDEIETAAKKTLDGLEAFPIEVKGVGSFASTRGAQVVWAGVTEGAKELASLAKNLEANLFALGFGRKERDYRPHITLARLKSPAILSSVFEKINVGPGFGRYLAGELNIMQSELRPTGPLYTVLRRCPLQGA